MKRFSEHLEEKKMKDKDYGIYRRMKAPDKGKLFRLVFTPNPQGGWINAIPYDHDGVVVTNVNMSDYKRSSPTETSY